MPEGVIFDSLPFLV